MSRLGSLTSVDPDRCGYAPTNAHRCPAPARWRVLPSCSHSDDWRTAYACSKHLGNVVEIASARCTAHMGGSTVRVSPAKVQR